VKVYPSPSTGLDVLVSHHLLEKVQCHVNEGRMSMMAVSYRKKIPFRVKLLVKRSGFCYYSLAEKVRAICSDLFALTFWISLEKHFCSGCLQELEIWTAM
jgi:hypothetical protein